MNRTPEQQEMLDLRSQTQAWIDSLMVGGMAENAPVTPIHMSLIERPLVRGGVQQTVSWLIGMAMQVSEKGPALLEELKAQGH